MNTLPKSYGYFNDAAREFVITDPRTPAKWINYIGTLAFGGFVDQTGGALLCARDPGLNRITKYLPQMPDSDFKGETLYLRTPRRDGGYKVFSPFYVPTLDAPDSYKCHVGLGYQRIVSELHGVRVDTTIFVPLGCQLVVRDIRITNIGDVPVEIDAIPVVEFSHFDALKQITNADWVPQTMQCDAGREPDGRLILEQCAFMKKGVAHNFFTSNRPVDSFQTDRNLFLGANGYGTWRAPLELQQPSLSNYEARRGNVIAALLHKLGTLAPGETTRLVTLLGQDTPDAIPSAVEKFRNESAVDLAFGALGEFWEDYLSKYQCRTPDAAFDSMVNVHNPRQCHTTLNWSRYLSLYQLGFGARGIGFRDSSQDAMGALASAPSEAKNLLRKLLSVQRPDGSAMHQFFPLTMEATEGDALEEGGKLVYGDDHLWIVVAVCAYLKETGDYAFLDEAVSYYDKHLPLPRRETGSVLDHLLRALDYTKSNTGRHGLPLLGFADWNDTINLPGAAESFFNAHLYGLALKESSALLRHLGEEDGAQRLDADHRSMRDIVNTCGWDGEWYLRYFTEEGTPLGSNTNSEGKIFTNAQSWPVIAGFATPERARAALDSVFSHLNTANGIKLSAPGYSVYDPAKGGVTSYPPGAKENGGIFLHSNPWVMIAETMLGHGDRAFQYFRQINPAAKLETIDRYEIEPYCYAQNILGDEHTQFGLGRNSWLSGTASWTYQAATQFILGIRPTHEGLLIDPCIPCRWTGFEVTRVFRGATYHIRVANPEGISKGVASLHLDGDSCPIGPLPLPEPGSEHYVEVVLMRPAKTEESSTRAVAAALV